MSLIFAISAAIGGTVLICQLILVLIGLGGEVSDVDGADAGGDFGGDFHGDISGDAGGADFHADAAGEVDADTPDLTHGADVSEVAHAGHGAGHLDHGAAPHASTVGVFKVVSFRTLVAALTFFGLSGLAAQAADYPPAQSLIIAAACGLGAMYGVYWLMRAISSLRSEGTVHIGQSVGRRAMVYLKIPARQSGCGKIHVDVQNRTMEYLAVSAEDAIPAGTQVVVLKVLGPDTVLVAPLAAQAQEANHVQ
ncbi:MAG: hypothetical protein Kow0040_05850 [Thermogutta sp.]